MIWGFFLILLQLLQSYNSTGMPTPFFFFFHLAVNVEVLQLWGNCCKQARIKFHKTRSKHKRTLTAIWGLIYFFKDVTDVFKAPKPINKSDKQSHDFMSQIVNAGRFQIGGMQRELPLSHIRTCKLLSRPEKNVWQTCPRTQCYMPSQRTGWDFAEQRCQGYYPAEDRMDHTFQGLSA